jgi:hypothetical protein
MEAVLFIIGAIWTIIGSAVILYTEQSRKTAANLTDLVSLKVLAVVPMAMGGLLMISAPWSQSIWAVEALGALGLAKGILFLVLPGNKSGPFLAWWREKASEVTWRCCGLILVILGVFIILRI